MSSLIDKSILFVILILLCCMGMNSYLSVISILLVISFSCIFSYTSHKIIHIIGLILYSILCIFLKELILFFPLLWYDILFTPYQMIGAISFIPIAWHFTDNDPINNLLPFAFLIITGFIRYKTQMVENQKKHYVEFRDSAQELSLSLKKKNSELLEKQDYEVKVATLKERNRIAMEIHDNVGHLLSSSILQIGAILTINKDDTLQKKLELVSNTLSTAMDSIRDSVHNIHDESLLLEPQIKEIIEHFEFCPIQLDYQITNNPNAKITYAIITTLKEALSNIIKHSNATTVNIIIREHPALYQIQIKDNGILFEKRQESGIGLKNMESRVYELNGIFHIETTQGFKIFISIPKESK